MIIPKTEDNRISVPSGVYMHSASIGLYRPPISPQSHSSSTTSSNSEFIDHYAVLGLDVWSTSEEIKSTYRRLAKEYFNTKDMKKYRALQVAYAVLVDREARWTYDKVYREKKSLPAPPPLNLSTFQARVKSQFSQLETQSSPVPTHTQVEAQAKKIETMLLVDEVVEKDPNSALKRYTAGMEKKAAFGTLPYQSNVPILWAYKGREKHLKGKCGRPKYMRGMAANARP